MSGLVHVHTYLVIDEKSVFVDEFLQIYQHRWKFFHSFLSRRILTQYNAYMYTPIIRYDNKRCLVVTNGALDIRIDTDYEI